MAELTYHNSKFLNRHTNPKILHNNIIKMIKLQNGTQLVK